MSLHILSSSCHGCDRAYFHGIYSHPRKAHAARKQAKSTSSVWSREECCFDKRIKYYISRVDVDVPLNQGLTSKNHTAQSTLPPPSCNVLVLSTSTHDGEHKLRGLFTDEDAARLAAKALAYEEYEIYLNEICIDHTFHEELPFYNECILYNERAEARRHEAIINKEIYQQQQELLRLQERLKMEREDFQAAEHFRVLEELGGAESLMEEARACMGFKVDAYFSSKRSAIERRAITACKQSTLPDKFIHSLCAVFAYAQIVLPYDELVAVA